MDKAPMLSSKVFQGCVLPLARARVYRDADQVLPSIDQRILTGMVSNLRLAVLLLLIVSGLGIGMELHSELPEVDEASIPEILEAHHQILDLEEQLLDISCNRTAESSSNGEEVSPFDPDRATALAEERSVPLASPELNPLHSHILVSASENQDDDNRHKRDRQVGGNEHNYAAASLGAKVLGANKEGKGAGNILVKGNDKYFRNPCSAKEKFVMVELAEEILVETFVIANYELYSSNPRELELLGSLSYPTSGWRLLGKFEARNVGQPQRFILSKPEWARYLQLRILSHYGTEFYCTLSTFEVFGVALGRMLEDLIGSSPGDSTSGSTTSVNKFLIEQILQLESDHKTFEEYVEFSNSQNTAAVNEYQEELTNIMRQLKSLNDTVQKQQRLADDVFSKSMKELRLCRKEVARIASGQIYSLTVSLVAMLVVVARIRILVRLALTGFLVILLLLV